MYVTKPNGTFGFAVDADDGRFFVSMVEFESPAWRAGLRIGDQLRAYTSKIETTKCSHIIWNESALAAIEAHSTIGIELKKTNSVPSVVQRRMRYLSRWKKRYTIDGIRISNSVKQAPTFAQAILDWEERHRHDFEDLHASETLAVKQPARKRPLDTNEDDPNSKRACFDTPEPEPEDQEESPSFEYEDCLPDHEECMPDQDDISMNHEEPIEIVDDIEPATSIPTSASIVVGIQQPHAPRVQYVLSHGWFDIIESNAWLNDDLVSFMCHRYLQIFSYTKVRLLSPHQYQINFKHQKFADWMESLPEVTILPVCEHNHWSLVCITINESITVIHFDSKNARNRFKQVAKSVYNTFRDHEALVTNITRKSVFFKVMQVPEQSNNYDCGVHVISHVITLMKAIDGSDWTDVCGDIKKRQFKKILSREQLKTELEDALGERLYHRAYWGKWHYDDDPDNWWICRRITTRMAKKIDPKSSVKTRVPIIWLDRSKGDVLWANADGLIPIDWMSLEEAIAQSNYTSSQEAALRRSYESIV